MSFVHGLKGCWGLSLAKAKKSAKVIEVGFVLLNVGIEQAWVVCNGKSKSAVPRG